MLYAFSSVCLDRVKNEVKGSDPTDTMARQVAVFTYFGQSIQRIKANRSVRSPYTADEATGSVFLWETQLLNAPEFKGA